MFQLINTYLHQRNLNNPTLEVLTQDAALYQSLLFQPLENIEYSTEYIRIANRARAQEKFRRFFELAIAENVGLAVTPEYSCPWNEIEDCIVNGRLPQPTKLWIIGCESIRAQELQVLMERHPNIEWITELDKVTDNLNNNNFFNPVCYIFKTEQSNGQGLKTVVTVQFKTHPLGGAGMEWERDNFIAGSRIYIFQNDDNSSKLATLICSDILNPQLNLNNLPSFLNSPYLIVHIQLNTAPNNINYCKYRGDIYGMGRENKEFLCLNWGRNVEIDGAAWNQYGGSAIYTKTVKSNELDVSDDRINHNHRLGMYYTSWANRYAHINFLNYDEYVFSLRNTKPSQELAVPQSRKRTGPEMLQAFTWNQENNNWESIAQLNDSFQSTCVGLNQGEFTSLINLYNASPIDVERLVYICVGKANDKNWYLPSEITFLKVSDNEINSKITFAQNPCVNTNSKRKEYLTRYNTLENAIINNPQHIPDSIGDLRNNCQIDYRKGNYNKFYSINLYPSGEEGVPASGAYIGAKPEEEALNAYSKMIELVKGTQLDKRVVVWFTDHLHNLQKKFNSEKAKITDNTEQSTHSIRKKREA